MLASGDELAAAATEALGVKMQYEDISEYLTCFYTWLIRFA